MEDSITGTGSICDRCGAFVPAGASHTCPPGTEDHHRFPTRPGIDQDALFRKLDRIIVLLELLANVRR